MKTTDPQGQLESAPATAREGRKGLEILSIQQVLRLPPPMWLIDGVVEEGALGTVYAPPADGKTFVTVDVALSVATKRAWQGRKVRGGQVVYICAEGGRGIQKRFRAWLKRQELEDAEDAFVILQAVDIRTQADDVIRLLRGQGINPVLIVIDTLARCFSGDENSTADMGAFIAAAQRLQEEANTEGRCAVLLVHHTGKNESKGARGSSALGAAMDVVIEIRKDKNGILTIVNEKQKDDELFGASTFVLQQVEIGTSEEGRPVTSCVLEPAGAREPVNAGGERTLRATHLAALSALQTIGEGTTGEWRKATDLRLGYAVPVDTFGKWAKGLRDDGYVTPVNEGFPARYQLTEIGTPPLVPPQECDPQLHTSSSHATTPEGVA